MYKVDKNRGSVSSIIYHLIVCVKYRQKVFRNVTVDILKEYIENQ